MNSMIIEIKKVADDSELYIPTRATPGSAGYDIAAYLGKHKPTITMHPGETALLRTGLAVNINDPNVTMLLLPRSKLGNAGLVLGNLTGVIDSDYQGEILISAWNRSAQPIEIRHGQYIAQAIFVPIIRADLIEVDAFDTNTIRGCNGLGNDVKQNTGRD